MFSLDQRTVGYFWFISLKIRLKSTMEFTLYFSRKLKSITNLSPISVFFLRLTKTVCWSATENSMMNAEIDDGC